MAVPILSESTRERVRQLRERVQQIDGARWQDGQPSVSTGSESLDALLPGGGLQRGTLLECFSASETPTGSGAATLAMLLAKALAADGGAVVVMDRAQTFYPPAAVAIGINWRQLLIVRAQNAQDELWALDQSLRCPGVAAAWAPLHQLGPRDFRRLQLAVESSGAVGLLLRPPASRNRPSWAHVQLAISSQASGECPFPESGRRLKVELMHVRGAQLNATQKSIVLEIDEVTGQLQAASFRHAAHSLPSSSPVADSAPDRGTA